MASKGEDAASKHNDSGAKQQGGGRRRVQSGPRHHEDGPAKRKNAGQSSSTRHGNRGRSHSSVGGKESAQQHGKEVQQQSGGGGSGGASTKGSSWPREVGTAHSKQPTRGHHHRNSSGNNAAGGRSSEQQGRRGQQQRSQERARSHRQQMAGSSKVSESSDTNGAPQDSGISVDGGSSPEIVVENGYMTPKMASLYSADVVEQHETEAYRIEETTPTSCYERAVALGLVAKTSSSPSDQERGSVEVPGDGGGGGAIATNNTPRMFYGRKELLEMKECVQSLLKPPGVEKIPAELLKTSNRHAGEGWETHHCDMELGEDGKPKHPTTLSIMREHDGKPTTRVSLTPQRRSFGSGCSWRDQFSPLARQSGPTSADGAGEQEDAVEQQHKILPVHPLNLTAYVHPATPASPHGHAHHPTHRVISHVPYRSRQNQGDQHHWRTSPPQPLNEEDHEPEWMAYGPSDRTEFIELKGLDEHEARKEAERLAQGKAESTGTGAPISEGEDQQANGSALDLARSAQDEGKGPGSPVAERGPPPEEEDPFVLDGFDFSTGLSICHKLEESDSDEEASPITPAPAATAKASTSEELSSALMQALGVGRERPASPEKKSVVTLDEIEAPLRQRENDDGDSSAYNKLLAVLQSSGAMQDESPSLVANEMRPHHHHLGPFNGVATVPSGPSPIGTHAKAGPVPVARYPYHSNTATGLERDGTTMAFSASLQHSAQHIRRERQPVIYSAHAASVPPHSHPMLVVASSDPGTAKAAVRWASTGQQQQLPQPWMQSGLASSASSYPYYQQQQPSPMASHPSSMWMTEMERKRHTDLLTPYRDYSSSRQQAPAMFGRKAPSNGGIPSNTHGVVPSSIGLLPTSVIKQMRKPAQMMSSEMSTGQQAPPPHTLAHRRLVATDHEMNQHTGHSSVAAAMLSVGMHDPQPSSLHHPPTSSAMMAPSGTVYPHSSAYGSAMTTPHGLQSGALAVPIADTQPPPPMLAHAGYYNSTSYFPQQMRMGVATVKQSHY